MPTLAAMSLLAPAMLGGLIFVGLPIVAHLLHRNARTPVVFPSIRLLRTSSANQSSFFRLRRRLLLALRSCAIALLVLAFAEPLLRGARGESSAEASTTVVILDASASTQLRDGATTVFERLRGDVARIIEGLQGGRDQAEVVLADAVPSGLAGRLTPNLSMLAGLLRDIGPTDERADMRAALQLAAKLLADATGARRVVIVTDGQASNWTSLADSRGADGDGDLPRDTEVRVAAIPASTAANTGLEARGMTARRAAPGQSIGARVRIHAFGAAPSRTELRVLLDGRSFERRDIDVSPGQPVEIVVPLTASDEGPHAIRFELTSDALTIDDTATLAFETGRRQPVAILSDEDSDDPARGTYFLVRALAPYGDQRDRFAPRVVRSDALTAAALADVRTLFVADIVRLAPAVIESLRMHLARGGSIVWFCGGGPVTENATQLETGLPGLLPFMPGDVKDHESRLIAGAARQSLLSSFDDAALLGLGAVRIGRTRACSAVRDDAIVVLAFDDGGPALSLRRYGDGAFALANFSASPKYGDFARHGGFVALVQSLATELELSDGAHPSTLAGEALSIACGPRSTALRLRGPDGAIVPDAIVLQDRNESTVSLARASRAGLYLVREGDRVIAMGAVNVDPRESDARVLMSDALALLVQPQHAAEKIVASNGGATASDDALRGTPIWWLAILGVLCMSAIELALLAWWRR
ncbi:MAG: BatA domain-containing protein [Phycisphaerae bacterium]|nr:BatA domain-containing protein [Phycisphaerae bacterium]